MTDHPERVGDPTPFRARGVGEILAHAFEIYRRHWRNLIVTVAVIVVPLTVVQVVFTELVVDEIFVETGAGGRIDLSDTSLGAFVAASLVVALVSILTWTIATGAIARAAAGTLLGRSLETAESYRYGLARLGSILLVGLLTGLAIAGGLILLVIPGLFILTRLSCTLAALVIEDRRGSEALRRSWNLVAGHGWHVFGTIIVAALMTGLLASALEAPFRDNAVASGVAQTVAALITIPYSALVGILIYLDLRVRAERYAPEDLERDLARTAA